MVLITMLYEETRINNTQSLQVKNSVWKDRVKQIREVIVFSITSQKRRTYLLFLNLKQNASTQDVSNDY